MRHFIAPVGLSGLHLRSRRYSLPFPDRFNTTFDFAERTMEQLSSICKPGAAELHA